jgi:hypothetical protein
LVADPAPADGDVDGDDDEDVDGDEDIDVVDACDVGPLVAAIATPAAPAPMPAARNAVMMKRQAQPPLLDVIRLPPFPSSASASRVRPAEDQHAQANPPGARGGALRAL